MARIKWSKFEQIIGKPVIITFDDHADGDDIYECKIIGWLHEITSRKVVTSHWNILNATEEETKANSEFLALAKGVIKKVEILKLA